MPKASGLTDLVGCASEALGVRSSSRGEEMSEQRNEAPAKEAPEVAQAPRVPNTFGPQAPYDRPPVAFGHQPPQYVQRKTSGLAIASLVTSLLGLSVVAIILGHIARKTTKTGAEDGDGLALAGLIIGYIVLAFQVFLVVIMMLMFVLAAGTASVPPPQ